MSECILWTGYRRKDGYGHWGQLGYAHRVAYERAYGPIPKGMDIDHLCFVKLCINPEHLRPLDPIVNRRLQRSASKSSCLSGHAYTAANTYRRPTGQRDCRACIRSRVAAYRERRKAA